MPSQTNQTPSDFDSYQLELRGYEITIREMLEKSTSFNHFKSITTLEIRRLGFSYWEYRRLDTPLQDNKTQVIGTTTDQQTPCYRKASLHSDHPLFDYANNATNHIYRSSINAFLNTAPALTDAIIDNNDTEKQYQALGYWDHVALPLHYEHAENHAVFILTCKNKASAAFIEEVESTIGKLHAFVNLFETVAIEKFPESILGQKQAVERFKNGRALKLLELMAKEDLGIDPAAKASHMSRTAADKQLAKLRDQLGAKSTHGALYIALQLGLINLDTFKKEWDPPQ